MTSKSARRLAVMINLARKLTAYFAKGLRFPVSVNLNGGVSSSQFEENVRQSLFIILGTAPGERIMRPDFGCRIHDLMFAPNNDITAARAEVYCDGAIYKDEPRDG